MTNCHGLKLPAPDRKMRETDCADTEGLFRIIQSIPSPKAEPFKRGLAKVGYERIQEIENPELATKRTRMLYKLNENSQGVVKLKSDAKAGGSIAGDARKALEKRLGRPIVSAGNYLSKAKSKKKIKK